MARFSAAPGLEQMSRDAAKRAKAAPLQFSLGFLRPFFDRLKLRRGLLKLKLQVNIEISHKGTKTQRRAPIAS